jgi:Icc-related predicted phosphoesterase
MLIISDIHASTSKVLKLENVERDLTIVAGDMARCGSLEEALAILDMLANQSQPVVWVPGNCDNPQLLELQGPKGTYNVHGKVFSYDNLSIIGVGGSPPTPFNTPLELSEDNIKAILEKAVSLVSSDVNLILVSHSPPYASGLDRVRGGTYVGSKAVAEFIKKHKPILVASGHIHESWGVSCLYGSLIVNPGPLAEGRYALALYDEENKIISIRLRRL